MQTSAHGATLAEALGMALRDRGLVVDPSCVAVIRGPHGFFRGESVLFAAHAKGELNDIYYADMNRRGTSTVITVRNVTNITRTSSANEEKLLRAGNTVFVASKVGDGFDAFLLLDTRGEPKSLTRGWPLRPRIQNAITNFQETGRFEGFGRKRYGLNEPSQSMDVKNARSNFHIHVDNAEIVVSPFQDAPFEGANIVELRPYEKSQPGVITWIVDTTRNVSWIGPKPIEWLEHTVFAIQDRIQRAKHAVVGSGNEAAEAASDLAVPSVSPETPKKRAELAISDAESGWPPKKLEPLITPFVEGEGQWIAVADDPFVQSIANAPPAFYQTFLRADPERTYAHIYITIWDPRQVQLHVVPGTREPESATGETGTGLVPRDDETLSHFVAGFNGGFQAMHGEFGMMADGRVYLPPKPWAATVAVYDDGHVAMGSWRAPENERVEFDEESATRQIPDNMIALRQNLTSVVEDGKFNPWGRWWWGAAPEAATEQTYTHRTGLCLTSEGFMAYFWGPNMGPEALGAAMIGARCVRGMHLDMNSKHTGFEFYRLVRRGESMPARGPLDDSTFEGPLPNEEGAHGEWIVRTRKAVRSMDPMRFPRYVHRDPRDFFYLTLRSILPGPDLDNGTHFSVNGLPHAGWPHAFAKTDVGSGADAVTLLRIDPNRARYFATAPVDEHGATEQLRGAVLARLTHAPLAPRSAAFGLWMARSQIGWRFQVGRPMPEGHVIIEGAPLSSNPDARAAIGVDANGFWIYAEKNPGSTAQLQSALAHAGVAEAISLDPTSQLIFCDANACVNLAGEEADADQMQNSSPFYAETQAAAEVLFPDNAPLPYRHWGRLQGTRIRYFKEGAPRFVAPPGVQ